MSTLSLQGLEDGAEEAGECASGVVPWGAGSSNGAWAWDGFDWSQQRARPTSATALPRPGHNPWRLCSQLVSVQYCGDTARGTGDVLAAPGGSVPARTFLWSRFRELSAGCSTATSDGAGPSHYHAAHGSPDAASRSGLARADACAAPRAGVYVRAVMDCTDLSVPTHADGRRQTRRVWAARHAATDDDGRHVAMTVMAARPPGSLFKPFRPLGIGHLFGAVVSPLVDVPL